MDWNGNLAEAAAPYMKGSPLIDVLEAVANLSAKKAEALRILNVACDESLGSTELERYGCVAVASISTVARASGDRRPELADVVYSDGAFDLVTDQISLLKNVACCLPSGGLLVGEMGAFGNAESLEDGYAQAIRKHSGDYVCQFCFPKEKAYRRALEIAGFEVVAMSAFDKATPLENGRDGLRLWAESRFAKSLALYRPEDRELVLEDYEKACEERSWNESSGCWVADYRRLRFVARKSRAATAPLAYSPLRVLGS